MNGARLNGVMNKNRGINRLTVGILIAFALRVGLAWAAPAKPNVLFIVVDDLRPTLGCYGDPVADSPAIDRLARQGTTFLRAYCQQAVCCPSRLSVITGLRPDTIQVWDLKSHFRQAVPDAVSLPQYFKHHGYETRSIGKILHGNGPPSKDPPSWSAAPLYDVALDAPLRYATPENLAGEGLKRDSHESAPVDDEAYVDGKVCQAARAELERLAQGTAPFFLAVGFRKPHLPFNAPETYWKRYRADEIPPLRLGGQPTGAPEWATRSWRELEGYRDIPKTGPISSEKASRLRHGYYACVSYVDALVGRLIDRLEALSLRENTVICLWSDHGFHLGEQGLWAKANNYELSTRVPLILSVPQHPVPGATSSALVELVDLFPTLVEVCGLPALEPLEGISFKPLLAEPGRAWKRVAFSQYPRAYQGHRHKGAGDVMGNAIRTERYRYVEWRDRHNGALLSRELYDHRQDPWEMTNVVRESARTEIVQAMQRALNAGWRAALPEASRGQ